MRAALEIRALRLALALCLRAGIAADWLAPRIARRLAMITGRRP